ncbi:MAG: hypothetical protein RLY70_4703 [Planctomycetota bacterium]
MGDGILPVGSPHLAAKVLQLTVASIPLAPSSPRAFVYDSLDPYPATRSPNVAIFWCWRSWAIPPLSFSLMEGPSGLIQQLFDPQVHLAPLDLGLTRQVTDRRLVTEIPPFHGRLPDVEK